MKTIVSRKTGLAIVFCLMPNLLTQDALAGHQPADKIAVSAAAVQVVQTQSVAGTSSSGPFTSLTKTFRTSDPTDLVIQVAAETVLGTDITLLFPATNQVIATVTVWVELDGVAVPVTHDANGNGVFNDPDDGKVVFNNRDLRIDTNLFATGGFINFFHRSRSAHAFKWVALNVGAGLHTVNVRVQLDTHVAGSGVAVAGVGKRIMVIEPVKLVNDIVF